MGLHPTAPHATCINPTNDEADLGVSQYAAAKYYRLAEKGGSKTLGNSWYVIPHVTLFLPPKIIFRVHVRA